MKFAIKSLAIAAALVAVGATNAQTVVTAVPGVGVIATDPAVGGTRKAEFTLLNSYSGGNALAGSFVTGGDLIFSAGAYIGGTAPSSITAIGGTLGALNVGKIKITGSSTNPGIVVTEQYRARNADKAVYATEAAAIASLSNPATMGTSGPLATTATTTGVTRVASKAGSTIAGVQAIVNGPNAGNILVAAANGAAIQTGTAIPGTLTGGKMTISNIRFDIQNKQVIADASGTFDAYEDADGNIVPSGTVTSPNLNMWTFAGVGDVTGPTRLNPASVLAANPVTTLTADGFTLLNSAASTTPGRGTTYTVLSVNEFKNLQITPLARQFFIDALGLGPTGIGALDAVNASTGGWGKVSSNLVFKVQEVPEPSTYALMGLGLVGISLVARRRRAAAK